MTKCSRAFRNFSEMLLDASNWAHMSLRGKGHIVKFQMYHLGSDYVPFIELSTQHSKQQLALFP